MTGACGHSAPTLGRSPPERRRAPGRPTPTTRGSVSSGSSFYSGAVRAAKKRFTPCSARPPPNRGVHQGARGRRHGGDTGSRQRPRGRRRARCMQPRGLERRERVVFARRTRRTPRCAVRIASRGRGRPQGRGKRPRGHRRRDGTRRDSPTKGQNTPSSRPRAAPRSPCRSVRELPRTAPRRPRSARAYSRAHPDDFKRVAVVTDSQWVTWSAWLSQTFVSADVEVFDNADEANSWLESGQ